MNDDTIEIVRPAIGVTIIGFEALFYYGIYSGVMPEWIFVVLGLKLTVFIILLNSCKKDGVSFHMWMVPALFLSGISLIVYPILSRKAMEVLESIFYSIGLIAGIIAIASYFF